MEGYIAEIRMFGGNFAPRAWAFCHGQLLSIDQYSALYALVGTIYGGDGVSTFGLPDLRSRVSAGTGQGAGLPNMDLGEMAGTESVTILSTQLPAHSHTVVANNNTTGMASTAVNGYLNASTASGESVVASGINLGAILQANTISASGSNQPMSIIQPYTGMNYIICLEGIFPSRN